MVKQQKDIKQRIEDGEFSQSAEISASYLDEDILIIDNIKVLANPDPVRLQMNMIASCQEGSLKMDINGKVIEVSKNDIFVCPPNSVIDVLEVSPDFACVALCVTNRGMQNRLDSSVPGLQEHGAFHLGTLSSRDSGDASQDSPLGTLPCLCRRCARGCEG